MIINRVIDQYYKCTFFSSMRDVERSEHITKAEKN
ncbi:hypothetical protein BMW23_1214 [Bodo saltans virus]|uniref:Uncharacterized protein n=1 Tax=Bodo saltans virus TaxID=2024608 RepID=A0A2H4UWH2_9VIRU|nr:hypothetical protein QJ851_gp1194 [Bodo saltans virus]ATZ81257.1 hypothetical protein BMW23_1214 [Bodo saltans virus]